MNGSHLLFVLAGVLIAAPLSAREHNARRGRTAGCHAQCGRTARDADKHRLRPWLNQRVDRVSWDDATLSDVIDWLKAQRIEGEPINIFVMWPALEIESIDADEPVSLDLQNVTIREVLDLVLRQLSDQDPLTYEGRGSILIISTQSDLQRQLYTRLYDISDILMIVERFTGAPQVELSQTPTAGGGGPGGQTQVQPMFENSGGGDDEGDADAIVERGRELMDWIRAVVEPNSWKKNGGLGTMAIFDGTLAVRNTARVHTTLIGVLRLDE